jgi:hypothetical protein
LELLMVWLRLRLLLQSTVAGEHASASHPVADILLLS